MLRNLFGRAFCQARPLLNGISLTSKFQHGLVQKVSSSLMSTSLCNSLQHFSPQPINILSRICKPLVAEQKRTYFLNKFNLRTGRRKTNYDVIDRFYRLHWGMWIRVKAGRAKKLWKKAGKNKKRLRYHVMCNATQCTLLDKMVTGFWRRERFLVNDPYAPYHKRENFYQTRRKPMELPPLPMKNN
ncbi:large ribosomal subunit protein bL35m [Cloeon dipterum]|uniref:large ribosomal subunit protein bL35m n=1 Tax=Cloeon dipterum TaxID=197152 RepID=UPI003220753F